MAFNYIYIYNSVQLYYSAGEMKLSITAIISSRRFSPIPLILLISSRRISNSIAPCSTLLAHWSYMLVSTCCIWSRFIALISLYIALVSSTVFCSFSIVFLPNNLNYAITHQSQLLCILISEYRLYIFFLRVSDLYMQYLDTLSSLQAL